MAMLCATTALAQTPPSSEPLDAPPTEAPRKKTTSRPSTPPVAPPSEPAPSSVPPVEPPMSDSGASAPVTPPSLTPGGDIADLRTRARNAADAANWSEAVVAWNAVLEKSPNDAEATAGLQMAKTNLADVPLVDQVQQELSVRAQRLTVQFNDAMIRSDEKLGSGDYAGAMSDVQSAQQMLDRDRTAISPAAYEEMFKRATERMDKITGARVAAEATKAGDAQNAATKQVQAQRQKLAAERQKRLNENLLQVRKLQMEMKYDEAMQVLDQILFEEPPRSPFAT
ncbi:MAG: hypothetical protein EBR71_05565 [Planctomycetes bacterium]|nr:hypothetical protein [Planctomycetota bacterium]